MKFVSDYFNAEKAESILFISVGLIAILLGFYFLFSVKTNFTKGVAYPILLIALIQLVVGSTVYFRSPKDIIRVETIIKNDPAKISTEEIPRMHTVMKSFQTYKYVEIALVLIGIIFYFTATNASLWKGVGLGLFIQASLMLLLDFFAEKRGREYLE